MLAFTDIANSIDATGLSKAGKIALTDFEREFRYPLNSEQWFQISHGNDYSCFYRSLGAATCIVACDQEAVVGICAAAVRDLHHPFGEVRQVLYVGDLKISAGARNKRILWRLARALMEKHVNMHVAYSVVMEGTTITPTAYTGRAYIPRFSAVSRIRLWQIETLKKTIHTDTVVAVDAREGEALFRHLAHDCYFSLSGNPSLRSSMPVQWWVNTDGSACGRLEDTRRAKKLYHEAGHEMVSAHLCAFAYKTPLAGDRFLREMLAIAADAEVGSMWVTAPETADPLPQILLYPASKTLMTHATLYGIGLEKSLPWHVFSAEI